MYEITYSVVNNSNNKQQHLHEAHVCRLLHQSYNYIRGAIFKQAPTTDTYSEIEKIKKKHKMNYKYLSKNIIYLSYTERIIFHNTKKKTLNSTFN